ncbi:hypothetical protein [Amycolatopsis sp. NPDC059657]|uniref:hypothetical protein n=1 Tax=Amycolatopsis sp. NPDC059657 TaxID=3346899 RepID=UPI00366CFCB4
MHDATAFTDPENWAGGFYELSLEVGGCDDDRLQRLVSALWRAAGIVGCYRETDLEPVEQQPLPVTVASLREFGHVHGVVRVPLGGSVVCGCFVSRFDDDASDWLTLYLPLGALGRVERRIGGFPFEPESGPESLNWRAPLDTWLAEVAAEVFRHVEFRFAVIGFEHDYPTVADLPEQRWNGYLLPVEGRLTYTPADR